MNAFVLCHRIFVDDSWIYDLAEYHTVDNALILRDATDENGTPEMPIDPNLVVVEMMHYQPGTLQAIEDDPRFL